MALLFMFLTVTTYCMFIVKHKKKSKLRYLTTPRLKRFMTLRHKIAILMFCKIVCINIFGFRSSYSTVVIALSS